MKRIGLCVASLLLFFSIAGCVQAGNSGESESKQQLVVMDWGGATTAAHMAAMYQPFEQKYGVKITVVTPTDFGKLKAMVTSGNVSIDVASVSSDFVIRGANEGLLEKLDYNVINREGILEEYAQDYGVGAELTSTVISYNTNQFPAGSHPKNWSEFWDTEKFPGPRALWKSPFHTLEIALLADGVEPENLYPLDVDRAFQSLDKLKKNVKVWWEAGAQPPQLLANGEVALAAAWNGRVEKAIAEGAPEELEYNQGIIQANSWVVPKGGPNKDLAMKFIAFAVEPEQQAAFSSQINYAPANTKALELLPDEVKKRLGQSADKVGHQIILNDQWWVDHYDQVNERFQQWLIK
ncbi:ABC transporter substrate-binding protein [Brevibacillus sp. NRS-1366]|uniref:ABC transporter substrate-binding protein n=1 Tax=Brevibacillus sp. NRS-1366 TaxID=3233899 RepID=UPI003D1F114B